MKRLILFAVFLGLIGPWIGPAWAQDPFTLTPETRSEAPAQQSDYKNRYFAKIVLYQQKLKQKIADLIRESQDARSVQPFIVLMGLAFLYGLIHAAGPGHGKLVATAYILSHRATIADGLLFGLCFALIHTLSGAAGVVGLHYIIHSIASQTLASATTTTQIVSYSLITLLGLDIAIKHGYAYANPVMASMRRRSGMEGGKGVLVWAATVGLVPCHAVVMVILFCISLDAMMLGLLLAASISAGMAVTISLVAIAMLMGKIGVLGMVAEENAQRVEAAMGLLSGAAISIFGVVFLLLLVFNL